jgi:hypothetical protein
MTHLDAMPLTKNASDLFWVGLLAIGLVHMSSL